MFNILKFQPDEISGMTDVSVTFQMKLNGPFITDGGTFKSRDQAKGWLHQIQKDCFLTRVDNYIVHKKRIIENAPKGHVTHLPKLNALAELLRYAQYAANNSLFDACKYFIISYKKFESVLPAMSNPSYKSSTECVLRSSSCCSYKILRVNRLAFEYSPS